MRNSFFLKLSFYSDRLLTYLVSLTKFLTVSPSMAVSLFSLDLFLLYSSFSFLSIISSKKVSTVIQFFLLSVMILIIFLSSGCCPNFSSTSSLLSAHFLHSNTVCLAVSSVCLHSLQKRTILTMF